MLFAFPILGFSQGILTLAIILNNCFGLIESNDSLSNIRLVSKFMCISSMSVFLIALGIGLGA